MPNGNDNKDTTNTSGFTAKDKLEVLNNYLNQNGPNQGLLYSDIVGAAESYYIENADQNLIKQRIGADQAQQTQDFKTQIQGELMGDPQQPPLVQNTTDQVWSGGGPGDGNTTTTTKKTYTKPLTNYNVNVSDFRLSEDQKGFVTGSQKNQALIAQRLYELRETYLNPAYKAKGLDLTPQEVKKAFGDDALYNEWIQGNVANRDFVLQTNQLYKDQKGNDFWKEGYLFDTAGTNEQGRPINEQDFGKRWSEMPLPYLNEDYKKQYQEFKNSTQGVQTSKLTSDVGQIPNANMYQKMYPNGKVEQYDRRKVESDKFNNSILPSRYRGDIGSIYEPIG